jgi:glycosyltransferase involved in cell wall biosynthesis
MKEKNSDSRKRIVVINSPINKIGTLPLSNLLKILIQFSDIFLIINENREVIFDDYLSTFHFNSLFFNYSLMNNPLLKICNYLLWQIKYSIKILRLYRRFNIFLSFREDFAIILIFVCKILKKPTILLIGESNIKDLKYSRDIIHGPIKIIANMTNRLSSFITLYSPNLISDYKLTAYHHKILIAHEHFLDFDIFAISIPYRERPPLIGNIGRLSSEKGIDLFFQAFPRILEKNKNIRIFIVGDGSLRESIEEIIHDLNLINHVEILGGIPHVELPKYLNQLRLLVLPSYTAGLPNIILEAIAERGRKFMEQEFTFKKAVERWGDILGEIQ